MSKVTLKTILEEMRAGFTKVDARFREVNARFNEVDVRFNKVDENIHHIAAQTAIITHRVSDHERRIKSIEGPNT